MSKRIVVGRPGVLDDKRGKNNRNADVLRRLERPRQKHFQDENYYRFYYFFLLEKR